MAFDINSKGEITMPAGDSAQLMFSVSGDGITLGSGDSILFVVYDKYTDATLIEKEVTLVNGLATVSLSPADTNIVTDDYLWNMRIKNGTNVLSMFANSPRFTLTEVGGNA